VQRNSDNAADFCGIMKSASCHGVQRKWVRLPVCNAYDG